ncbi:MAG TPA: DUF2892 domain-containing protein [Planctomicrobium sp.]|nr:DUF2892 domain-containing protein [Planctomicrobium sp.]
MFPTTVKRVPDNTAAHVNAEIHQRTVDNIARFRDASIPEIRARIQELDAEWDIERVLEANAASATLIGTILGLSVDRRWLWLPIAVGGFLLQHALQGWCPPLPVFRRLGIRTSYEIDEERFALFEIMRTRSGGRHPV